jgi:dephospho-CoA kinase
VIDAALLFFWNWHRKVHLAILVSSTRPNKLRRLTRQGLTLTEARNRLASQLSEAEMRPKADLVIPNNGTVAELMARARRFYRLLQSEL